MWEGEDENEETATTLLAFPKKKGLSVEKNMVTTHCGHLFHHACLTKWFSIKKKPM